VQAADEVKQMVTYKQDYFNSPWNYFDCASIVIIAMLFLLHISRLNHQVIMRCCCALVWHGGGAAAWRLVTSSLYCGLRAWICGLRPAQHSAQAVCMHSTQPHTTCRAFNLQLSWLHDPPCARQEGTGPPQRCVLQSYRLTIWRCILWLGLILLQLFIILMALELLLLCLRSLYFCMAVEKVGALLRMVLIVIKVSRSTSCLLSFTSDAFIESQPGSGAFQLCMYKVTAPPDC
jgi:hypothetical protein